ncbi:MAG: DUF4339 domain-containing protein [Verrucomicrobiota bacterium]|nr:DUF4339 domain-containing protein [Verrucomicrobiota bacterium]
MPDEWFVRVEGKEYGPVDLETLLEWKAEGRLIPQNEVRAEADERWLPASQFPELFAVSPDLQTRPDRLFRRRTFSEIMSETLRIYARGFPQFFALALFVAVPSLVMQISFGFASFQQGEAVDVRSRIAGVVAVLALAALLVCWPIFVAGLQFAAAELAAGRKAKLRDVLRQAVGVWPRMARLSLFVYGSYLFWTLLPVVLILSLASTPSALALLVAMLALGLQVYMAGRLFVNFLFWQQSCTLAGLDGAEALRESKDLARSRRDMPAVQRPAYRGAIIASVWLVVLVAASVAVEMPFTVMRLRGVGTMEEAITLMQQLLSAPTPDALTLASNVLSSLVHAALRPLLGIAFVVLYFDARGE